MAEETQRPDSPPQLPSTDDNLRVSEIFESIQGEGTSIGTPSVFLRLAMCNLRCSWCDTKYTWDWANYKFDEEVRTLSPREVAGSVRAFQSKNVVVTGGEPLLQQRQLAPVLKELASGKSFEIETAGTICPSEALLRLVRIWNVSPKLENSSNALHLRRKADALAAFAAIDNAFFKFVVQSENDLPEVHSLVRDFNLPRERVLLMPEATTQSQLADRGAWLASLCIAHGFRMGHRLHVTLWGSRRGV